MVTTSWSESEHKILIFDYLYLPWHPWEICKTPTLWTSGLSSVQHTYRLRPTTEGSTLNWEEVETDGWEFTQITQLLSKEITFEKSCYDQKDLKFEISFSLNHLL